jgi:Tol biopolymer transport system component
MDLDGSNVRPLTDADVGDWSPTWSPDGSMIAFGRAAAGNDADTYVVDVDSGDETYLTTETEFWWWVAWSPDSSQIAFVTERDGNPDVYVMATDGTGQTSLTSDAAPDYAPSWPPGGRIFFTAERGGDPEVYSMDEAGGSQTDLTNNSLDEHFPVASRDGSLVAFRRIEQGIRDIYVMSANGTGEVKLTPSVGLTTYDTIRWSPDGGFVAFASSAGMERQIHRADPDGEEMIDLTDGQARDEGPSWTPDSQHIVFISDRDGDEGEIYIMDADGGNQTRLTDDPAWDRDPAVSPGG